METLRCLVCQGQSIADSDADMAGDMRAMVRERIKAGEKPEAIRALADRALRRTGSATSRRSSRSPGRCGRRRCSCSRLGACSPAAASGGSAADGLADHPAARRFGVRRASGASAGSTAPGCSSLGAALLLAVAGYAWQGRPGLAGSPKRAAEHAGRARKRLRQDAPGHARPLRHRRPLADHRRGLQRDGDTRGAADIIRAGAQGPPGQCRTSGSATATLWSSTPAG